jgi:phosphoadenosine phosphosulfate reductase
MGFSDIEIQKLNAEYELKSAEDLLRWAAKSFPSGLVLASSFGAEDVVLIDLLSKIDPAVRIVTLDTGRLPEETYQVMDAVRRRYGVKIEVFFPDAARVESLVRAKGLYSFRESIENRKECCRIRKVEPLKRALAGAQAWITGLRRDQTAARQRLDKLEIDGTHGGIVKLSPLADWTEEKTWGYIKKNQVPYNRLHDLGFRSIGCEPCTRAVKPGEDVRSGRWWWENPGHKECGIHPEPPRSQA